MIVPPRPLGAPTRARELKQILTELLDERLALLKDAPEQAVAERAAQLAAVTAIKMERLGPEYEDGYLVMVTELSRELYERSPVAIDARPKRRTDDDTPREIPIDRKRST